MKKSTSLIIGIMAGFAFLTGLTIWFLPSVDIAEMLLFFGSTMTAVSAALVESNVQRSKPCKNSNTKTLI